MRAVLATDFYDVLPALALPINTFLLIVLAVIRMHDRHNLKSVREDAASAARIAKEAGAIIRQRPGGADTPSILSDPSTMLPNEDSDAG